MRTKTHHTTLCTLLKRVALCGLAALALSASGLRPAAAMPPEPIDPPPPPPIVYKPDLVVSNFVKSSANWVVVTVKNQGNASSKSCTFRLTEHYLDTFWWEIFLVASKDYYVPAIGKGSSYSFWVNTSYSVYNNPYFYFTGTVDVYNVVSEKIETNNENWFSGQ
jgi:hypothetical protein